MVKVCFFIPSLNIGGVENVFITYANELTQRGYDVRFVLCHRVGALMPLVSESVHIDDLGNSRLRKSFLPLRRYLKKNSPDILITGGDYPNLMCILATRFLKNKPKVIISKHNYRNAETKDLGWWSFLDQKLQEILYPKADRIIAVSNGIKKYLTEVLKLQSERVIVLNNPIDLDEIIRKAEQKLDIELPDKYVVFVGRTTIVKNLRFLINSFDRIEDNDLHLLIVGDGPELKSLEDYRIQKHSCDRIHFVGSYSNPMPFIRNARTLVLCSLSEAYPTILLESMTLNVPIVATPTEGAKEILNSVEGVYLSNSFIDEQEFSELIKKALSYPSSDLKKYVIKNDKDRILNQFENILCSIKQ